MSDAPDDTDLLAAEYVLGTLDPAEARQAADRVARDAEFAARVVAWQNRLAPLADLAEPVPPPVDLWQRIDASAPRVEPAGGLALAWRNVNLWRGATAAGFALAASLAFLMLIRQPPVGIATLLPPDSGASAVVVERPSPGRLHFALAGPVPADPAHDMEIWVLPAGATRPVSLGVMPAGGASVAVAWQGPAVLMISREPRGGSPTGQPTGPVIYQGTLPG